MISPLYKLVVIISNIIGTFHVTSALSCAYYIPKTIESVYRLDPLYTAHHVLALGACVPACFIHDLVPYKVYMDCITLFDLTGLFVDIYTIAPRTIRLKRMLYTTYIAIRCMIIPYILHTNIPFDANSQYVESIFKCLVIGSGAWCYAFVNNYIRV